MRVLREQQAASQVLPGEDREALAVPKTGALCMRTSRVDAGSPTTCRPFCRRSKKKKKTVSPARALLNLLCSPSSFVFLAFQRSATPSSALAFPASSHLPPHLRRFFAVKNLQLPLDPLGHRSTRALGALHYTSEPRTLGTHKRHKSCHQCSGPRTPDTLKGTRKTR